MCVSETFAVIADTTLCFFTIGFCPDCQVELCCLLKFLLTVWLHQSCVWNLWGPQFFFLGRIIYCVQIRIRIPVFRYFPTFSHAQTHSVTFRACCQCWTPVRLCGMFKQNESTVEPQIIRTFFEWFSARREARVAQLLLCFKRGHLTRIDWDSFATSQQRRGSDAS